VNESQPQSKRTSDATAQPPTRVSSESLLGPRGELLIIHKGREYRLRLTQNGKLILTA
jgi:hemin uptake protein HemP